MYVVAITERNGTIDAEAAALAVDLGVTPYEARLTLASGTPTIVRMTVDRALALDLLARLRARGHGAIAIDGADVVPSHAMISMRRFRLEPSSIALDDRADELPYDDISALLAAVHRQHTTSASESRDKKLSVTRAVMSGGLVMTKTVKRETRTETTEREPVVYVFRRSGGTPWLLRERGTLWTGHGRAVSPMASENLKITVAALRERAPGAVYDDRLVTTKSAPQRFAVASTTGGTTTTTSSEAGTDLLAHLLALSITERNASR